jgi:hypothetical protein
MGKQTNSFPNKKVQMKSKDILVIIESVYNKFLSPEVLSKAKNPKAPCLENMLLCLQDFSSIVECNFGMEAGDIGRVLNIWRRWSVMAQ